MTTFAHQDIERIRLAQQVARLWTWDYDVASGTVTWIAPVGGTTRTIRTPVTDVIQRIHPDDRELVERAVQTTLQTGREYILEHRTVTADGKTHWLAARGARISERPLRLIGVTVDICHLKRLENLRRMETNAAVAAKLAHSINNPLQALVNTLHCIEAENVPDSSRKHLATAREAAFRIGNAVKEIVATLEAIS